MVTPVMGPWLSDRKMAFRAYERVVGKMKRWLLVAGCWYWFWLLALVLASTSPSNQYQD